MKPTGLIRILFTATLALLVMGGMSVAHAQSTFFVDKTNGSDGFTGGQNDPFETVGKAVTEAVDGDSIIVRGGDYSGENVPLNDELFFRVAERPTDGELNAQIGNFTVSPGANAVVDFSSDGSGFFTLGGLTLSNGTAQVNSTAGFKIASGATITRNDGALAGNAPTFNGQVNLTYAPSADIAAGLEAPADLNNGTLTVNSNVVSFSGLTVGAVAINGGGLSFGADFTVNAPGGGVSDVVVPNATSLSVGGTLTLSDRNANLDADGDVSLGTLTIADFRAAARSAH